MATLAASMAPTPTFSPAPAIPAVSPANDAGLNLRAAFDTFVADTIAQQGLTEVMLLTTLPGLRLPVVQSTVTVPGVGSPMSDRVESIAWQAILEGSATELAGEPLLAVRIDSPVLGGYPGAVVARATRDTASPLSAEGLVEPARQAFGRPDQVTEIRQYFFRADGSVVAGPGEAGTGYDGRVETARRALALMGQETDGPNRVLVAHADGEHEPAVAASVPESSPLGRLGITAVVSFYPRGEDWSRLTPNHFAADEELSRMARAIAYMTAHYHEGPTLEDVATSVQLSQFHFHRRFTERVGITPKHLLFNLQLERAKQMLADPRIAMSDIARACGFAHQSHFTSRFKQGTAQTPSAWRRQALRNRR